LLLIQNCQIAETAIPRDFIKDKNNLSSVEVDERFGVAGRGLFNKEKPTPQDIANKEPAALPPVPEGITPKADFATRLRELRLYVMDLGLPRIKEIWLTRFKECLGAGHDYGMVMEFEDFLNIYRTQVYNSKRRADVNIVCNEMWGTGQCFVEIERLVMDKMQLKYTDKLVSGSKCKTNRKHGSIKSMYVRMKQTYFVDAVRLAGLRNYKEVVYKRYLKKPMEGVVAVVKVTKASHGYDGWLGLGVGHPQLLDKKVITPTKPEGSLMAYLQDQMKSGTEMTTAQLLEAFAKENKGDMVVSVSDASSTSSPLTESTCISLVSSLIVLAYHAAVLHISHFSN
jgi:hypothetical protein